MKSNLTDITFILDRSGSMGSLVTDTIGGFNTFVETQKGVEGECVLSLVQFDDQYQVDYVAKPLADVEPLTTTTYQPRGWTALNDAIGKTINTTGARLNDMKEEDRPGRVVVVIITDGFENASREFNKTKVKEMIEHQESNYAWEFIFLGANMDAVAEGASYGTKLGKTMTWAANADAIKATYDSLSDTVAYYRTGGTLQFSDSARAAASAGATA